MSRVMDLTDAQLTQEIGLALQKLRMQKWVRSCLSKVRYRKERKALNMADRVRRRRGTVLRAYLCEHCAGWHLTKKVEP